jgi:uncharacterized protein YkwD
MPTCFAPILRTLHGRRALRSATLAFTLLAAALTIAVPAASAHSVRHAPKQAHVAQSCANADTPELNASSGAVRGAVMCLINQQRAAHNLPALKDQSLLDRSAQGWTNEMIRSATFWHGSDFATRITAAGFVWSAAGENIATGFTTPRAVVSGWMASAGHCSNILDPSFSSVGTGVGRSVAGKYPSRAVWTQDFALRMGQPAPSSNWAPARGCPYTN